MSKILVGTASWSDPGFVADWYPKQLPARERLAWYAERFNLVEVNSSFYAIPQRSIVQRWTEQTPDGFVFDVKLHRFLSRHATTAQMLPADLRPHSASADDKLAWTPELESQVAERFIKAIAPLKTAGKLGALLLQLSPGFSPRAHSLEELAELLNSLAAYTMAVELRNRNWLTGPTLQTTVDFFRRHKLAWVGVDAPPAEHFTIMPPVDHVTHRKLAYLRCHGRNTAGYLQGRTVAERFDYLYNEEELEGLAKRAEHLGQEASTVHVIFNNNTSHYAPTNAAQLREMLEQKNIDTGTPATPIPRTMELELDDIPPFRRGRLLRRQ